MNRLLELAKQRGVQPGGFSTGSSFPTEQPPALKKSFFDRLASFGQGAQDLAVGAAKGAVSTIKGASDLGQKIFDPITNAITGTENKLGQYSSIIPQDAYTTKNNTEKVGFGIEQVAEFLIPAGKIAKAEKAVDLVLQGSKMSKLAKATTKVVAKGGIEGVASGMIRAAQTGDIKEGVKTGLTAGALRGAFAVIGEGARAIRLPERLYNVVFKNTADDVAQELKSMATKSFQQKNPARFNELVEQGVIKLKSNGEVIVNETLARQALDRGLRGSIKNMAEETVTRTYEAESTARNLAKGYTKPIALESQYKTVLQQIGKDYKEVGFGEISQEAMGLAKKIKNGKVDATTALEIRRFLDGMRFHSSYNPGVTKLSMTQQNFKTLSDSLRGRLAKIPGFANNMKDYGFYIEALETLANEAKRRGNNQIFGLIDTTLFGGGFITGEPLTGASIGLTRKALNSPTILTSAAQKIKNASASAKGVAARGLIGAGIANEKEDLDY